MPAVLRDRIDVLVVGLFVVLGILARVLLMDEPLRFDEAFTMQTYTLLDPRNIGLVYTTPNNHPFNTLLMHYSVELFGQGLWGIRLPAFIAGCLAPIAAWWVARELYGRLAGVWAAGLVASSLVLVDFSVNGRGYVPGALLLLIAFGAGIGTVRGTSPWPPRVFMVAAPLAVWSVPTTAYGVIAVGIWMLGCVLLVRRPDLRRVARVAGTLAVGAVLAGLLMVPLSVAPGWTFVPPLARSWASFDMVGTQTWNVWRRGALGPIEWGLVFGFLVSFVALGRRREFPMPLAGAVLAALVVIVVLNIQGPLPRSWIALLPLCLVATAGGLAYATEFVVRRLPLGPAAGRALGFATLGAVIGVMFIGAFTGDPRLSEAPPQSSNELADFLREERPGEQLLINYGTFGPNIDHHLKLEDYPVGVGKVLPKQLRSGRVLTVTDRGQAEFAKNQVAAFGGPVSAAPPRTLREFKYIGVYEIELDRAKALEAAREAEKLEGG